MAGIRIETSDTIGSYCWVRVRVRGHEFVLTWHRKYECKVTRETQRWHDAGLITRSEMYRINEMLLLMVANKAG